MYAVKRIPRLWLAKRRVRRVGLPVASDGELGVVADTSLAIGSAMAAQGRVSER
jgi:hypothetical protein